MHFLILIFVIIIILVILDSEIESECFSLFSGEASIEVTEKFAKLEARVLGDVGAAGTDAGAGELGSAK